jgi:peptide/nickel transport system permease protein
MDAVEAAPLDLVTAAVPARPAMQVMRVLASSPKGLTGAVIFAIMLLTALFAPVLAPHDPAAQVVAHRFIPPAWRMAATGSICWAATIWAATSSAG